MAQETDITVSNNAIIEAWELQYAPKLKANKDAMGIKHDRLKPAKRVGIKNKKEKGEIKRIGVIMSKGEVMTHKGKGKYPEKRREKPWFNPTTQIEVDDLANQIAQNTGDVVVNNFLIR